MALYIPSSRRRRRTVIVAVVALAAGLAIGIVIGRSSSTSLTDRVRAVQEDARQTASGLRVLSLHEQSGVTSDGADLVLERTRNELAHELDRAPWISPSTRTRLLDDLRALAAQTDTTSPEFGSAADALAAEIEDAFGLGA